MKILDIWIKNADHTNEIKEILLLQFNLIKNLVDEMSKNSTDQENVIKMNTYVMQTLVEELGEQKCIKIVDTGGISVFYQILK